VAELPEKLMHYRFLPLTCWFSHEVWTDSRACAAGPAPPKQLQCVRRRDAWPCPFRAPAARPSNTADQLRSGAPAQPAGGGTGRHLSLPFGCRPELRQLHPLVGPHPTWPRYFAAAVCTTIPTCARSCVAQSV